MGYSPWRRTSWTRVSDKTSSPAELRQIQTLDHLLPNYPVKEKVFLKKYVFLNSPKNYVSRLQRSKILPGS